MVISVGARVYEFFHFSCIDILNRKDYKVLPYWFITTSLLHEKTMIPIMKTDKYIGLNSFSFD